MMIMIMIIVLMIIICNYHIAGFKTFNNNNKIMSKSFAYINSNNNNNDIIKVNNKIISSIIISISTIFSTIQLPIISSMNMNIVNADDTTTSTTTIKEVVKGIIEVDGEIASIYRKAR